MRNGLIFIPLLLTLSCQQREIKRPGICISFDDRSVKEWDNMRELLNKYDARVTFFVTQFDSLDTSEMKLLKKFEQEGHEIGSHGALHVVSEYYIREKTYGEYIKNEIDASINSMRKYGFSPKSFAYPYGAKYWFTDLILLRKFDVLRTVEAINTERDLSLMDNIFYSFNGDRTLSALGIDRSNGLTKEMIQRGIERAVDRKEVLMLYGHSPVRDIENGPYNFDIEILEFILEEVQKNNLEFIKYGDLGHDHPQKVMPK